MAGIYTYATSMGRAGLGNRLFTWAQAEIFSREHAVPMLAPQWVLPKIGPILRGENDWRMYGGQFSRNGHVGGLRRLLIMAAGRWVEPEAGRALVEIDQEGWRPVVVYFADKRAGFAEISEHREYLKERARALLSRKVRQAMDEAGLPARYIGVHVRRGDHGRVLEYGEETPSDYKWNIPERWFVRCVQEVRSRYHDLPVVVFSDAAAGDLPMLAATDRVIFAPRNGAITDLMLLAKSHVIIGSNSTFSLWAAFLGSSQGLISYQGKCYDPVGAGIVLVAADVWGNLVGLTTGG